MAVPEIFKEVWGVEVNPITYDLTKPPIKTYCSECGHETGEEQPHTTDCRCQACEMPRRMALKRKFEQESLGKSITFRRIEGIR